MTDRVQITRPDDWHLHLRDGAVLRDLAHHSARTFRRAIVMPNLRPPIRTVDEALAYRRRILDALPPGTSFDPRMTLYLTQTARPQDIVAAARSEHVQAVKLYPAGSTTNAESGVTDLAALDDVLRAMEDHGVPLLVHGESTDPAVDVFDREAVFLRDTLGPLIERYPGLRVVLEHVTTEEGVHFVRGARDGVAATITPQHLLLDRNAIFRGGLRPHMYCLPVLKREKHRRALVEAATSGDPRFFLGTDSAPHPRSAKESRCGCAGIFTAHAAIELYAEVFEDADALHNLEAFAARNGPAFYGLPRNEDTIVLERVAWTVPDAYPFGDDVLIPFRAGESVRWRVAA